MRKERILWLTMILGVIAWQAAGQEEQHGVTPPGTVAAVPTVVAMTSDKIPLFGDTELYHLFRVWSDGSTEWACHWVDFGNQAVFWGDWQATEDMIDNFCP